VSTTTASTHNPEALLQEADLALYRAKDRGRDRAEVFDEELRTTAVGRLGIEQMTRQAMNEDRLVVRYQPIIDLTTGHVTRVEALVRIQGPDGLIYPDGFIDVAEEAGLLTAIDQWVLGQAIKQAKFWAHHLAGARDFCGVAINVTARHLADSYFAEKLADLLADNGLPDGTLSIEVTERILMQASNSSMDTVRTIRGLGVNVGLDDFGTGYSSLAYLRDFPLDFIKIDQSFIRKIHEPTQAAIVTAIIELAHALDLLVVAEGVETDEQRAILVDLGCDRAQGFLFAHAEEASVVADVIRARTQLVT
jgi:EAL domain-containing protein (putative c-di-GMP-specific phosphodiesterase class I)